MIGAIIGDVIGSIYEWERVKYTSFDLFSDKSTYTDDSVMTIATALSVMTLKDYSENYRYFGRRYPNAGYGGMFYDWVFSKDMGPYNSYGNGSAMRVSPIAWAFEDPDSVIEEAKRSAEVTHNHPEGIKGAQATALATYLARLKLPKEEIRGIISRTFEYDLNRTCDQIRPEYVFNETCQETVPQAIIAFLDSTDFESAIRLAVSLGGDSDTLACITGGIAQAYYPSIPQHMALPVIEMLPQSFLRVIRDFNKKYNIKIITSKMEDI